jgi:hypothetical protein
MPVLLLLVFGRSFGCLERINLLRGFFDFSLDVRCCWAVAGTPFTFRFRINFAVLTSRAVYNLIATFTFIDNYMTAASVESTAFLGHEGAF